MWESNPGRLYVNRTRHGSANLPPDILLYNKR